MGPWHIFKLLAEAVWSKYAPIVFAKMWLKVKKTACPETPKLKDILVFFIAIAQATKSRERWNPGSEISHAFCLLIYELIPFVSHNYFKMQCSNESSGP